MAGSVLGPSVPSGGSFFRPSGSFPVPNMFGDLADRSALRRLRRYLPRRDAGLPGRLPFAARARRSPLRSGLGPGVQPGGRSARGFMSGLSLGEPWVYYQAPGLSPLFPLDVAVHVRPGPACFHGILTFRARPVVQPAVLQGAAAAARL
jgi:hypothetical protein